MEKALLITCFICVQFAATAQRKKPENLPQFDNKTIHFGFQLGVSQNGFSVDQDIAQVDSLIKLTPKSQPGFVIHVVSELHLGQFFGLRFTPGISFAARDLNYEYLTDQGRSVYPVRKTIESTYVEAPIALKYRSKRVNNFAQYVAVGFNYAFDLASQQKVDNTLDEFGQIPVKIRPENYNLELAVGFDYFLEYFKFTPEFKFSYGLKNVLFQDNTIYSSPIVDLRSRMFVVSFNFEG